MILGEFPIEFLRTFAIAFGLAWGSFLNVVIYRVPREMSVVRPASHCPACGKPIRALYNVPVFGWLILRGRARCCGAKPQRIGPPRGVYDIVALFQWCSADCGMPRASQAPLDFSPKSARVLSSWQARHIDCRFTSSSPPPFDTGTMWSTCTASVSRPCLLQG